MPGKVKARPEMFEECELHTTKQVQVGDRIAQIDVEIAPLIEEIWKADINTWNSCEQNSPGIIWIEFATVVDGERFLNIVSGKHTNKIDSIYNRILAGGWDFDCIPNNFRSGEKPISFSLSVRFPVSDYATVLRRIKLHNKATA